MTPKKESLTLKSRIMVFLPPNELYTRGRPMSTSTETQREKKDPFGAMVSKLLLL